MKKIIFSFALISYLLSVRPVLGVENTIILGVSNNNLQSAAVSASLKSQAQTDSKANKIIILKAYLNKQKSPLAPYAEIFVESADKYNIDWKLLPAITGIESSFGKHIPYLSYNGYGWCGGNCYFASWEESIETVTAALRQKYYNRGLDTPHKIGPVWAPPSTTWAGKVSYFMKDIENFENASLELVI